MWSPAEMMKLNHNSNATCHNQLTYLTNRFPKMNVFELMRLVLRTVPWARDSESRPCLQKLNIFHESRGTGDGPS